MSDSVIRRVAGRLWQTGWAPRCRPHRALPGRCHPRFGSQALLPHHQHIPGARQLGLP